MSTCRPRRVTSLQAPKAPYVVFHLSLKEIANNYHWSPQSLENGPTPATSNAPDKVAPPPRVVFSNSIFTLTTTVNATVEASEIREGVDTNSACPVPGGRSTFARHSDPKGMLLRPLCERCSLIFTVHVSSHNKEMLFQCEWPGCGKGFSSAHDYEQLHVHHQPRRCEGCGESLNTSNWHRKGPVHPSSTYSTKYPPVHSEGGLGCLKTRGEAQASGPIDFTR